MSTRKPHVAGNGTHAPADPAPLGDLPRQQLAAGTQAACALFRGFESIRKVQQKAAHQALAHHQALADKLKEPCHPMDLLAIQAELLRFDMQGAAAYWQQVAAAMLEMQRDLLAGMGGRDADGTTVAGHAADAGLSPFFFTVNGAQHATAS